MEMTVTQYNRDAWARVARAAYQAGHDRIGDKFHAAATYTGQAMPVAQWDALQSEWRAWLVFNRFAQIPELEPHCGSWVVVSKATGKPVLETSNRKIAEAINLDAYRVLTAAQWLGELNQSIRAAVRS